MLGAILAIALAACTQGQKINETDGAFYYHHDDAHKVSCWTAYNSSIDCLPDSEVQGPR